MTQEAQKHVRERQERLRRRNSRLELFFADPRRGRPDGIGARAAFLGLVLAAAGLSLLFADLGWFTR